MIPLLVSALFSFFNKKSEQSNYQDINVSKFKELMTEKDVVVIDVRTQLEISRGMIKGSKTINVKSSDFTSRIMNLDNDKKYLVYCRSGRRSANACNIMARNGFSNLYNLKGGYIAWSKS